MPVGDTERVCFNAHRVFAIKTILENLAEMTLIDFAYIKDRKIFTVDAEAISTLKLHSDYACGLYTLMKN